MSSHDETWSRLTRGVPAHVVVQAMNRTTRGINWSGCTKAMMREAFVATGPNHNRFNDAMRNTFAQHIATVVAQYTGDGAHIRHDMETLNLPAFAVAGDHVETILS